VLELTSPPTYWRCEPGWSWAAQPLADYLIWYVMDGIGELQHRGRHHRLRPGAVVVFAPGDAPRASHDPRCRLLVFGMHFAVVRRPQPGLAELAVSGPQVARDQEFLTILAARAYASYRHRGQPGGQQARLCLEQMICLLHEESQTPPPVPADLVIDDIARQIRQDPGQRWTVPALARHASLSAPQFTRRFRARTGSAPGRFVVLARVERARRLLAETTMTVAQIAADLGYTDPAHFSRQYRQHSGRPPTASRLLPPRE
jgi:AraC-like DNA-binding protein